MIPCCAVKAEGYVRGLKAAGFPLSEIKDAGYTLDEIKADGPHRES